ncbi:MAG: helix-turn-helix domain-containing protein [Roseburia sp.]|nr:helix-turn-helix domain-containing protein [Roseburia sp.]
MDKTFSFLRKTPGEIQTLIAGRIRMIRRRRKISQKKLSELSGVSLGSVKRFEQSGEISFFSLIKIAAALGLSNELERLFEDVPPLSMEELIRGQDETVKRFLP